MQRRKSEANIGTSARRKLEGLAKRHKLTATSVLNRVVDWLANQPELIQAAVLGKFPGAIDQELAKLIIQSLVKPLR